MEGGVMERRHSTDSNDSSNCSKQGDETNGGGRVLKPTSPKPPANALQFVKTGPCDLYRKAQEQIKKAEQIKKEKQTMRNDTEEWQSNLDNWKSSRRKMQEHIIERVVEVKKLELEEHERSRRRSKTFSEMMQERGRKASIPVYDDNSANDFSDLGLSSNGEKMSNESSSMDDSSSDNDNQMTISEEAELTNGDVFESNIPECNGSRKVEEKIVEEKKELPTEKEEYTYERAIQNYVNFAETRVKSLSARSIPEEVKVNGGSPRSPPRAAPPIPEKPRRSLTSTKVESVFSKAELYRKSVSTTDLTESNRKVAVPKVDISKRRELFEKFEPEMKSAVTSRSTVDLNSSKSIKERLSFLEKNNDSNKSKSPDRPSPEISVKDRLTSIENLKRQEGPNSKSVKPGEISSTSIKDRLTNLEKSKANAVKQTSSIDSPTSIKDRLSSLQSACNKEINKTVVTKPNPDFHEKLNTFQEIEASTEEVYPLSEDTGYGYSSEDLFEAKKSRHYRHRSLDSLDVDDSPVSNDTFERVQSYEDLDYCRNYPASSISGDTDREDSGIHTADVSSSVSQADDFDLHLDSNLSDDIKIAHQHPVPTVTEELKMNGSKSPTELVENVSCLRFEVPESSPTPRVYSKLDCSSPLPAILENPAEFNSPVDIPIVNTYNPFNSLTHSSHGDVDKINHISTYRSADLSSSSEPCETDIPIPEPRTSLPSDCDNTVIEVCEQSYSPEAKPSEPFSTLIAHSSTDLKNFNGFDAKDVSNSSDVTLVEIEEINDTEVLDKDLLLLEDEPTLVQSLTDLDADESDIVSTTNQIIALHSRDQSSEDLAPALPPKMKEIPPPIPINNNVDCLMMDMTVVSESGSVFPLSPTALEPPKEKPPPPPTENSDDDLDDNNPGVMRRMDSAKRIKKEIRLKRSSFLGLDGTEDNYIDPDLELTRPPDMTALLTEERRLERQLYRQSLCSETDSNQESRDSGVELDNKTSDTWVSHSRTNSDNFGNQSITSEEDDIMKKEREIIETLEEEERIRKQQLGEKLAMRLRELEAVEKDSAEWHRIYNGGEINHIGKSDSQVDIIQVENKENFNRDVEKVVTNGEGMWYDHSSDTESVREPSYLYSPSPPVPPHRTPQSLHQAVDRQYDRPAFLPDRQGFQPPERQPFQMAERQAFQPPERQTFQQPERQSFQPEDRMNYKAAAPRQNFQASERQFQQVSAQPPPPPERPVYQPPVERQQFEQPVHYQQPVQRRVYTNSVNHEKSHNHGHHPGAFTLPYRSSYSDLSQSQTAELKEAHRRSMPELQALTIRSMPDLQQTTSRPVPDHRRPPPPALPAKPNHLSASSQQTPQPMTRTTKQALSAAPRSRIISNESWQVKRKPKQENCNYQHWLIQEAEHRRITEQQKRQSSGMRQQAIAQVPPPPQPHQLQVNQVNQQGIQQGIQQAWSGHKPIYTSTPAPPQWTSHSKREKPLPDSIIQTLTQRVQNRKPDSNNNRRSVHRYENVHYNQNDVHQEKVLSVSGKKRCSACGDELGRGAAMIIESLQLFYHIDCFKCCVCCMQLGDGLMGTDVRVRNNKLHCHNCYSSDDGAKFSCV